MKQYHILLEEILGGGDVTYEPRTREFTLGLGGEQSIYDLREGFPLMTTKNVPTKLPFEELFWKLRGERNVKGLFDRNVHIWDANAFGKYLRDNDLEEKFPKHSKEWEDEFKTYRYRLANEPGFAEENGDLGPVYGHQWRRWGEKEPRASTIKRLSAYGHQWGHWKERHGGGVDQLSGLPERIRKNPGSRYHVLSAWNVAELPEMSLGPCPAIHHFNVFGENVDLNVYQRSCDVFLGAPFNIAQDSLFLHMMARETGLKPRKFIHSYGNVHAYLGVPPRSDFWADERNVEEFQKGFGEAAASGDYLDFREWYLATAPAEGEGNEGKDHVPYILTQLSKPPRKLPSIELKEGVGLFEAIEMPAAEYATVRGYDPHKWDSRARMAA